MNSSSSSPILHQHHQHRHRHHFQPHQHMWNYIDYSSVAFIPSMKWLYIVFVLCYFNVSCDKGNAELFHIPHSIRQVHESSTSLYGYSVAVYIEHKNPFVLIGAPNVTLDSTLPDKGKAYRVAFLEENGGRTVDTSRVPIAETDLERQEYNQKIPAENHWLGATVVAAERRTNAMQLTCDPLYRWKPKSSSPDEIDFSRVIGFCALYTGESLKYAAVDPCPNLEEGACLAGFSASLMMGEMLQYSRSNVSSSNSAEVGVTRVALGLPGSYLTEGNIHISFYTGNTLLNRVNLRSRQEELKQKGYNLGFAIAQANLLPHRKSSIDIITTSSIWHDNEDRGIILITDDRMDLSAVRIIPDLWGHVGSFFGYSVLVGDFNGDGKGDILVGSPFYSPTLQEITARRNAKRRRRMDFKDSRLSGKTPSNENGQQTTRTSSSQGPRIPNVGRITMFYGDEKQEGGKWTYYIPAVERQMKSKRYKYKRASEDIFSTENIEGASFINTGRTFDPTNDEMTDILGRTFSKASQKRSFSGQSNPNQGDPGNLQGGNFGHSLAKLGDIDGDGIEDFAVGCPYCVPSDYTGQHRGQVFIFLGANNPGEPINQEPFQIISAADVSNITAEFVIDFEENLLDRPLQSFGWSLSGGKDLDKNGVPDLVIGDAFAAQVAFVYSKATIWFADPVWDLPITKSGTLNWSEDEYGQDIPCNNCDYQVKLHVQTAGLYRHQIFTADNKRQFIEFELNVDLDSEIIDVQYKRMATISSNENMNGKSTFRTFFRLQRKQLENDKRFNLLDVIIRPKLVNVKANIWLPVRINVTITPLMDNLSGRLPWLFHSRRSPSHYTSSPLFFTNANCGADNRCVSDLDVSIQDLTQLPAGSSEQERFILYYGDRRFAQRMVRITVSNFKENAYRAKLKIHLPSAGVSFQIVQPNEIRCELTTHTEGSLEEGEFNTNFDASLTNLRGSAAPYSKQYQEEKDENSGSLIQVGTCLLDDPFPWNTRQYYDLLLHMPTNLPTSTTANEKSGVSDSRNNATTKNRLSPSMKGEEDVVSIQVQVTSGNTEERFDNNFAALSYSRQLKAGIELSVPPGTDYSIVDNRTTVEITEQFTRVRPERLGPEFRHVYLLQNHGPSPVETVWVNLTIPFRSQRGDLLFYYLDHLRQHNELQNMFEPATSSRYSASLVNTAPRVVNSENKDRGECFYPEELLDPMSLTVVDTSSSRASSDNIRRTRRESPTDTNESSQSTQSSSFLRNPRSIFSSISTSSSVETIQCSEVSEDSSQSGGESKPRFGKIRCASVQCRVRHLQPNEVLRVVLRGWVWAETFFQYGVSDAVFSSVATVCMDSTAYGMQLHGSHNRTPLPPKNITQNIVFQNLHVTVIREVPLWTIILGILLGILALAIIAFILWKCGFFRRKRWLQEADKDPRRLK